MRVVICGGGVIGACTAYFLSQRQVEAVVVERTGIACAASGKSGGFLALDWCDGTPLAPLARRSFALHAELAAKLGGVGLSPARYPRHRRQRTAHAALVGAPDCRTGSRARRCSSSSSAPPGPPRRSTPKNSRAA